MASSLFWWVPRNWVIRPARLSRSIAGMHWDTHAALSLSRRSESWDVHGHQHGTCELACQRLWASKDAFGLRRSFRATSTALLICSRADRTQLPGIRLRVDSTSARSAMLDDESARRPVSRVLSAPVSGRGTTIPLGRALRRASRDQPGRRGGNAPAATVRGRRPPLFGLAPGGVYPAAPVARGAVRSCRTVSPLPAGCLAAPCAGGLFSVALSLGSPPPAVSRHRIPVEPGLSSAAASAAAAAVRPSGGMTNERTRGTGQAGRKE